MNKMRTERQKEQSRQRACRWYHANKEKAKERNKKWKRENRERCRRINREWRRNNPDKVIAYVKRWQDKNPGKVRRTNKKFKLARKTKLNEIKLAAGCKDCGYNRHPAALHFDHVRGKKSFVIATRLGYSWEAILKEISKCEIRCANCHAIRHAKT